MTHHLQASMSYAIDPTGLMTVFTRHGDKLVDIKRKDQKKEQIVLLHALLRNVANRDPLYLIGPAVSLPELETLPISTPVLKAFQVARAAYGWEPTIRQIDLAQILGISRQAVRDRVRRGTLPASTTKLFPVIIINDLPDEIRDKALAFINRRGVR